MDPDPPQSTPRKVKFAPKGPPRRSSRLVTTVNETAAADDEDDEETQRSLSRKVKEHLTRRGPKVDKKPPTQVAFSHGVLSSEIRTFGKQRERINIGSDATRSEESTLDSRQKLVASTSTGGTQELGEISEDLINGSIMKKKKDYIEPWDYEHSYYPTTLPLRRPYSGDPELLDKAEFGEDFEYDENALLSASDLGLLDEDDTPRMIFFQFPPNLPLGWRPNNASRRETADNLKAPEKSTTKQKEVAGSIPRVSGISTGTKGKEIARSSTTPVPSRKGCCLEELPEGYMGKMLVYKSGAVKLKLGDILYDVSPGTEFTFAQSLTAINTTDRQCCELGQLNKRAVVTPDTDSMLDNVIDLG
ncbi:DNA-directed RNA polymerase III subunit [Handroanthus impetiginosus]|uniref:DNA-directed RNA polymerase III subunit n=1 Tax=Handroanthus impetiginosus TaxID=429701 RepID=A0A2G9G2Q4_9LAMI|nr:DNA-directed RNA polymerase III subunit [Handroanthus impetiginosus]